MKNHDVLMYQTKNHVSLKSESGNKTIIAVSLVGCVITELVLLSTIAIFLTGDLNHSHGTNAVYPNLSGLIPAKLSLQLEQAKLFLESKLKERHPGWIAGYAEPVP